MSAYNHSWFSKIHNCRPGTNHEEGYHISHRLWQLKKTNDNCLWGICCPILIHSIKNVIALLKTFRCNVDLNFPNVIKRMQHTLVKWDGGYLIKTMKVKCVKCEVLTYFQLDRAWPVCWNMKIRQDIFQVSPWHKGTWS